MHLDDWDIWHTYTTYLEASIGDIEEVAHLLVESGLALCAVTSDGVTYWRATTGVSRGLTTFAYNASRTGAEVSFESDDESSHIDGYIQESWWVAVQMVVHETRLFNPDMAVLPEYVRVFPGLFLLISKELGLSIKCYPCFKIYKTGIVVLEYRVISSEGSLPLDEFIELFVNLNLVGFDLVAVPPGFAILASEDYVQRTSGRWLWSRIVLARQAGQHVEAIHEFSKEYQVGDFEFSLGPLSHSDEPETLRSISSTFFSVIAFVLSKPRRGFPYILLGQKRLSEVGQFWMGRPYIYIIKHSHQQRTAYLNEKVHQASFVRILWRNAEVSSETTQKSLPASTRPFSDVGIYVTSSTSLWVWSGDGLRSRDDPPDPNRGDLVYRSQVVSEVTDYFYMLQRRLFIEAAGHARTDAVIEARRFLILLRHRMGEASYFGEVRDHMLRAWEAMGIAELGEGISQLLQVREAKTSLREARVAERAGRALTVLFGLIAVPPLAKDIVAPIWDALGLWRPTDASLSQLLMVGIALAGVALLTLIALHSVRLNPGGKSIERKTERTSRTGD